MAKKVEIDTKEKKKESHRTDILALPSKRGERTEEVFNRIKEMIYFNQLAPGQKLIYRSLSRRLNVSTTPLIQALNRLKATGFVDYKPNRGYFVAEISETEARNLYHAREGLELYNMPAVINNLDTDKVRNIKATFAKYKDTDRTELILVDAKFHLKIAEYGGNQVIYDILKDIFERIYLKYRTQYIGDDRINTVVNEHRMLLTEIMNRDLTKCIEIIKLHVRNGLEHLIAQMRKQSSSLF